jgi:2-hydroxy-3-keto-5-methylthiopentenyl-1-phosphate phosphatase
LKLLLVDFDGTITIEDITNLIWDRYLDFDWRAEMLPPFRVDKISHFDLMVQGYKPINATEAELLEYVRPLVRIRPGFEELLQFCRENNYPVVVVSGGLDFYIKAFLPPGLRVFCYTGKLNGYWQLSMPEGLVLEEGQNFKVWALEEMKKEYPGYEAIYIGDGRNDFPVSKSADSVFAVKDSTLARLCAEGGVYHTEFTVFEEVVEALSAKKLTYER